MEGNSDTEQSADAANAISATADRILGDDLNIGASRVHPHSVLVVDVGLDLVASAAGTVAIEDKLGVALPERELLSSEIAADPEAAIRAQVLAQ